MHQIVSPWICSQVDTWHGGTGNCKFRVKTGRTVRAPFRSWHGVSVRPVSEMLMKVTRGRESFPAENSKNFAISMILQLKFWGLKMSMAYVTCLTLSRTKNLIRSGLWCNLIRDPVGSSPFLILLMPIIWEGFSYLNRRHQEWNPGFLASIYDLSWDWNLRPVITRHGIGGILALRCADVFSRASR